MNRCRILYKGGAFEIVEKKSRFIASTSPVESEEEAAAFIAEIRKKYWDAGHHCFAYVLGERSEIMRCGDDGEPSQTAGRPMLDVLLGEELHNACVVVTRYFGGTLLGTGGLVRAYSQAAKGGLLNSQILEKMPARKLTVTTDYSGLGKIQHIAGERKAVTLHSEYSDQVELTLLVLEEEADSFREALIEATNAKCGILVSEPLYYGIYEKNVILF